jgi:hypothetical protein
MPWPKENRIFVDLRRKTGNWYKESSFGDHLRSEKAASSLTDLKSFDSMGLYLELQKKSIVATLNL